MSYVLVISFFLLPYCSFDSGQVNSRHIQLFFSLYSLGNMCSIPSREVGSVFQSRRWFQKTYHTLGWSFNFTVSSSSIVRYFVLSLPDFWILGCVHTSFEGQTHYHYPLEVLGIDPYTLFRVVRINPCLMLVLGLAHVVFPRFRFASHNQLSTCMPCTFRCLGITSVIST